MWRSVPQIPTRFILRTASPAPALRSGAVPVRKCPAPSQNEARISPTLQDLAHGVSLAFEPVEKDLDVPAHAEVTDAQIEVWLGLFGAADLCPRRDARGERRPDHPPLRLHDPWMVPLPSEPDGH